MNDENVIIEKIKNEIAKIQPFMLSEGGILEFVKYENDIVLDILQKGYMYKDKLLRPAMVKIND